MTFHFCMIYLLHAYIDKVISSCFNAFLQKLMWPQYDISRRSYLHFKTPLSEVSLIAIRY